MMRKGVWAAIVAAGLLLDASAVSAFCGFYVGSAGSELKNESTMVVLMREGTKTVLSMQNDYRGPPEDFAMVVPVPVVLSERNVKTLPREVFERVDRLAAPRLVEYWEQDPCPEMGDEMLGLGGLGMIGHGAGGGGTGYGRGGGAPLVTVEAEFAVGEYDVVILGARDSAALDTWIRAHGYRIPEGAEAVLRPYVEQGMKFFVAKVDVERVRFEDGRAILSPLRVQYDEETFRLPVRLGLLNSQGTQDLVVHVLARNQRYEVANYPNVTIPTNLDVADAARERFGEFYAALLDRTLAQSPGAVVTEYAWQATGCDPCPGPVLSERDLSTLGGDVVLADDAPRQAPQVGQVRVSESVQGSMPREIVRRIVRRHTNPIRFCYEQNRLQRPGIRGTLDLRFAIDPTGAVADLRGAGGSLRDPALFDCVADRVRGVRFPGPEGERPIVTLRFSFSTVPASAFGPGRQSPYQDFVLTRLHYRYERDGLDEDLVFRAAPPIAGGREMRGADGALEKDAQPAPANNFQGRYAIRHPWEGAIDCESPIRGMWGGPPEREAAATNTTPRAATDTALAPRGRLDLTEMLAEDVPAIGVVLPSARPTAAEMPAAAKARTPRTSGGCSGCTTTAADGAAALLPLCFVLVLGWISRQR